MYYLRCKSFLTHNLYNHTIIYLFFETSFIYVVDRHTLSRKHLFKLKLICLTKQDCAFIHEVRYTSPYIYPSVGYIFRSKGFHVNKQNRASNQPIQQIAPLTDSQQQALHFQIRNGKKL